MRFVTFVCINRPHAWSDWSYRVQGSDMTAVQDHGAPMIIEHEAVVRLDEIAQYHNALQEDLPVVRVRPGKVSCRCDVATCIRFPSPL